MANIHQIITIGNATALCLVICLHTPLPPNHWLFHLAVPWFFFASGFWYAKTKSTPSQYWLQLRKRIKTLLVPYFLWNLMWFPILFGCNWIGWRYCGIERIIDGSWPCVLRCLGLSPVAWPALVPTWFLRALFVTVALIGALDVIFGKKRLWVCLVCWTIFAMSQWCGLPADVRRGFFSFGIPLLGCACFGTGLVVGDWIHPRYAYAETRWIRVLRHQLMPIYLLHTIVIVCLGWIAKACHCFERMQTISGDVILWCAGLAGAISIGAAMRRWIPRAAKVLFGGR